MEPILSTVLTIRGNNGNVGIGTTAPAYKLDVVGDVRFQKSNGANLYLSETGGNAGDVSGLYLTGNNSVWGGSVRYNVGPGGAINRLDFYHSLTGLGFSLISTGNVAIGTTTDNGYKLQVNGNAFIKGSGSTSGTTSLLVQNSLGNNQYRITDDGTHYFSHNGNIRLTIENRWVNIWSRGFIYKQNTFSNCK